MAHLKRVSKQEPCPICGKPDFCFWKERQKEPGLYNLYCNRTSAAKGSIISGCDGQDYVSIFLTDASTIFEEVKQREERTKKTIAGEKKAYVPQRLTVLDSVSPLPHQVLDKIYRCMMEMLPLYKFHAKYLLKEGWSLALIQQHGICSFPAANLHKLPDSLQETKSRVLLAQDVMAKLSLRSLTGVPGAYMDEKGRWTFHSKSGIVFPVYDENGLIYRLRIRMDYMDLPVSLLEDTDGFYYIDQETRVEVSMSGAYKITNAKKIFMDFPTHKGKYRNFSSFLMDKNAYDSGFIENCFLKGCEAKNNLLYAMRPTDQHSVCWITEGEKKALFSNYALKQPVIALPGVNSFPLLDKPEHGKTPLEIMRSKGTHIFVIAFDADRFRNEMVLRNQNKLALLLKSRQFIVYIAVWNESAGKGLDDCLASGNRPSFYKV